MTSPAALKPAPRMGEREFVVVMALLQALQAFAIDSMLPALGVMSQDLGVSDANQRQLVVGVFLICGGFGSLVPGALADRYGRRPVLLTCLGLYIGLTLMCALVRDFASLLVLRGLIGFCSAGLSVLPGAIIRDRLEGDRMARLQSLISMIFLLVPMIAPTIGQGILLVASWRWIFGAMALMAALVGLWVYLRLEETLKPEFRQSIHLTTIAGNMKDAVFFRPSFGYVLGPALLMGAMFGYINSSQQLVAEHFGAGPLFPLIFGGMAMAMSVASFANSRIVERFGARRVSHAALFVYMATALLQWWTASSGHETIWQFVPLMALNMCLMGFIGGNFGSISLQPFARTAGAAASVQSFVRMVMASTLGALIGQAYDNTARPIAAAMVLAAVLTLAGVLYSEKGRLFRRLNPPGAPRLDA